MRIIHEFELSESSGVPRRSNVCGLQFFGCSLCFVGSMMVNENTITGYTVHDFMLTALISTNQTRIIGVVVSNTPCRWSSITYEPVAFRFTYAYERSGYRSGINGCRSHLCTGQIICAFIYAPEKNAPKTFKFA